MLKIIKAAYQAKFNNAYFSPLFARKISSEFKGIHELHVSINQNKRGIIFQKSRHMLCSKLSKAAALLSFISIAAAISPVYAKENNLLEISTNCEQRHAVVLVGGYGQDWRYFRPWVEQLVAQDACVFGFTSDHTQELMSQTSKDLSEVLLSLQKKDFARTTILAHSMGGLIARHSLGGIPSGELTNPVVLHTYGTPWGGFFWANLSRWTPFGASLMRTLRVPMSTEIGTTAKFMLSLRDQLPEGVRLVVHHSEDDHTARPQSEEAREGFAWALGVASEVHTYRGVGHSEYVQLPVGAL